MVNSIIIGKWKYYSEHVDYIIQAYRYYFPKLYLEYK